MYYQMDAVLYEEVLYCLVAGGKLLDSTGKWKRIGIAEGGVKVKENRLQRNSLKNKGSEG